MVWRQLLPVIALLSRTCLSEQCGGQEPVKDLLYGTAGHYDVASHICCHNHNYAEHAGFLTDRDIRLFDKLDSSKVTVFYDSVCNKPLFVAPKGRSFNSFKRESIAHGWPSFRPEETVEANVKVLSGGRMESVCGTHLGHNLPDLDGARYCIDLVCIAGRGGDGNHSGFDPHNFVSKVDNPGLTLPIYMIVLLVIGALLLLCALVYLLRRALMWKKDPSSHEIPFSHSSDQEDYDIPERRSSFTEASGEPGVEMGETMHA